MAERKFTYFKVLLAKQETDAPKAPSLAFLMIPFSPQVENEAKLLCAKKAC
jgi:hypothetical protein